MNSTSFGSAPVSPPARAAGTASGIPPYWPETPRFAACGAEAAAGWQAVVQAPLKAFEAGRRPPVARTACSTGVS